MEKDIRIPATEGKTTKNLIGVKSV